MKLPSDPALGNWASFRGGGALSQAIRRCFLLLLYIAYVLPALNLAPRAFSLRGLPTPTYILKDRPCGAPFPQYAQPPSKRRRVILLLALPTPLYQLVHLNNATQFLKRLRSWIEASKMDKPVEVGVLKNTRRPAGPWTLQQDGKSFATVARYPSKITPVVL